MLTSEVDTLALRLPLKRWISTFWEAPFKGQRGNGWPDVALDPSKKKTQTKGRHLPWPQKEENRTQGASPHRPWPRLMLPLLQQAPRRQHQCPRGLRVLSDRWRPMASHSCGWTKPRNRSAWKPWFRNQCLLVLTGESLFHRFLGGAKWISSTGSI